MNSALQTLSCRPSLVPPLSLSISLTSSFSHEQKKNTPSPPHPVAPRFMGESKGKGRGKRRKRIKENERTKKMCTSSCSPLLDRCPSKGTQRWDPMDVLPSFGWVLWLVFSIFRWIIGGIWRWISWWVSAGWQIRQILFLAVFRAFIDLRKILNL